MSEEKENNQDTDQTATRENTGKRVDPILEHLMVEIPTSIKIPLEKDS